MKQTLLLIGGAAAGGVLGYFAFFWLLEHRIYAVALPGALLGLGASLGRTRFVILPVLCGLAALALGLVTDWQFEHFKKDPSLGYFLLHVHHLDTITLLMIALGGAIGFWSPYRRIERDQRPGGGKPHPLPTHEQPPPP